MVFQLAASLMPTGHVIQGKRGRKRVRKIKRQSRIVRDIHEVAESDKQTDYMENLRRERQDSCYLARVGSQYFVKKEKFKATESLLLTLLFKCVTLSVLPPNTTRPYSSVNFNL